MPFKLRLPSAADILIALLLGTFFKGPISLASNAVTGWIDSAIAEYFGWSSPSVVVVVEFLWQWVVPFAAAGLLLVAYHHWNSRRQQDVPTYKAALDVALLQNPERVKSSPLYVKLKYNFEPKAGYKSPANQVTDGKIEFQKLYDRAARNKDLESYLIAGHMAEWLRENARFCYASSADFFDVLKFIETRMDNLHAIFRNERTVNEDLPTSDRPSAVAQTDLAVSQNSLSTLSNEELLARTIRLASQMRKFETNSMVEVMNSGKNRRSLPALAVSMEGAFRDTYLIPAKLFRDEITFRLNRVGIFPEAKGPYGGRLIAFEGRLAGPSAVSDAADYLEISARRLL
jgi:hypothetical protein